MLRRSESHVTASVHDADKDELYTRRVGLCVRKPIGNACHLRTAVDGCAVAKAVVHDMASCN